MSSISDNRAAVLRFFAVTNENSLAAAVALLDPEATWWSPGGTATRSQMIEIARTIASQLAEPLCFELETPTAEDDRVAIEARVRARRTNGVVYANVYHFLFRFREGRIVEVREHSDTAHVALVWPDLAI